MSINLSKLDQPTHSCRIEKSAHYLTKELCIFPAFYFHNEDEKAYHLLHTILEDTDVTQKRKFHHSAIKATNCMENNYLFGDFGLEASNFSYLYNTYQED